MTAYTKAQKLRAKRGRPKMEAAHREPNGRISRAREPADKVALEARARHLGLSVVQAKDQRAATFIGYLNILGNEDGLSDEQYRGALDYLSLRSAYLLAIKSPNAMSHSEVRGNSGDHVTDAYVKRCQSVVKRYDELQRAIQDAQNADRTTNYWATLDLCIVQGQKHHALIPGVRCVCNVLARFFGVITESEYQMLLQRARVGKLSS